MRPSCLRAWPAPLTRLRPGACRTPSSPSRPRSRLSVTERTPDMPMKEIVDANPVLRKRLYAAYASVGTVLGAIEVAFLAMPDESTPLWLRVAIAVYLFVGGAFVIGARSKVDAQPVDVTSATELVIEPDRKSVV